MQFDSNLLNYYHSSTPYADGRPCGAQSMEIYYTAWNYNETYNHSGLTTGVFMLGKRLRESCHASSKYGCLLQAWTSYVDCFHGLTLQITVHMWMSIWTPPALEPPKRQYDTIKTAGLTALCGSQHHCVQPPNIGIVWFHEFGSPHCGVVPSFSLSLILPSNNIHFSTVTSAPYRG